MDLQNFYNEQIVDVGALMLLQTTIKAEIQKLVVGLQAKGILSGLAPRPTAPVSLGITIGSGSLFSDAGAYVNLLNDTLMDLSAQGVVSAAGKSRWISIIATPGQISDTPVVTLGGVVQYRTADVVNIGLAFGDEATTGQEVKPSGDVLSGVLLLGDIHRNFGQASFQAGDIDLSRSQHFTDIPALIALIANHISAIDHVTGLQAALDGKSNTGHGHIIGDILGLQAALDAKISTNILDCQVNLAPVVMDGTNKIIFQTVIPGGTIKPTYKGIKIHLRFSRPVGHNAVTFNILANGNALINFPAYAPVAGAQGNLTTDFWEFLWTNIPGQNNAQVLWNDCLINAAPPVGAGQISTATVAASGTNIDWSVQQTIQWIANGPGPDQVSPGLWLIEFLR